MVEFSGAPTNYTCTVKNHISFHFAKLGGKKRQKSLWDQKGKKEEKQKSRMD